MIQSVINVRMDDRLKNDFDALCSELGITMSTAITIFVKKAVREQRIPFDMALDPFYSKSNMAAIEKGIKDVEEGRVVNKTLEELRRMENG